MKTQEIINRIPPGRVLIVHASFKPCKEEGLEPLQVLTMLRDKLGEEGTLMLPTFSYSYSGVWKVQPYDKDTTPGIENGILSETFRKMPGVLRSDNPTYSVAAWGKHARKLTEGSIANAGLGHGSSYENACKLNALILFWNVETIAIPCCIMRKLPPESHIMTYLFVNAGGEPPSPCREK